MRTIILSLLVFSIHTLSINSQVINYLSAVNTSPSPNDVRDYSHIRVKYDPQGNVRIITYDGERFFEVTYKDGYFSSFKPIAKGKISNSSSVNFYDFDIDTSGVLHIACTVLREGQSYYDSTKVYMYYTNSQVDSIFYLGTTSFPKINYSSPYFNKVNVLRTTDNKIVINYLHYSQPESTSDSLISIKWTQLVNPSANNLQTKYRQINMPVSDPFRTSSRTFSLYANKNLFVNLYQYSYSIYPSDDTLFVSYSLLKYDIDNPGNDAASNYSTFIRKGSGTAVELPIYTADYNAGNVHISRILVTYNGGNIPIITSAPLSYSIFTLDRENKLHILKFSNNQVTYYRFDNLPVSDLSGSSLSHTVDKSKFFPFEIGDFNLYFSILKYGSIAALNRNNAVFLFNDGEYLIHQLQGNFNYRTFIPRKIFFPHPLRELSLALKDNRLFLFNATRTYANLNDSTLILPLFEIREQNNEFRADIDQSSFLKIQVENATGLMYPFAKVDQNNQIHLLIFKFLRYGPALSQLGQWYYYKVTNNWQGQGGERVVDESDTLYILSPIDFDIDGNGAVHVVYFRYLGNNKSAMVYTNNSSGTFATPIVIPDTLGSSSGNWFRVKATRNGKAYIVYYNSLESKVNVIYGDLNGFTNSKRLFVNSNAENGGGRNKVSFEVDYQGYLHCFDMSDFPQYLRYAYKVIGDSVILVNRPYSIDSAPQFVTTAQDKDWNIYVLGVTNNEKIYFIRSLDNFQNVRTYDLANYGTLNFLTPGDIFWDYFKPFAVSERGRVYFYLGKASGIYLLGWIPMLPTEVEKEGSMITDNFALHQNYPNPFNPSTYITFELPKRVKVRISVYDVVGRLVKVLLDEEMPAGSYKVEFRGNGLPSGVYFYRLEAGNFMSVKKMVLVK